MALVGLRLTAWIYTRRGLARMVARHTGWIDRTLDHLLRHIEFLDGAIAACDRQVETLTAPHAEALTQLDTIPGVARRTAEVIAAELGCDMTRFPTAGHAASWTGLCPG